MGAAPPHRRAPRTSLAVLATFGAALLPACGVANNDHGNYAARGTGDVSHPPPAREATMLTLRLLCPARPNGADSATTALRRAPYLQQVHATGATVVWAATGDEPARVFVSDMSGAEVTSAPAEIDASAPLPGGARQLLARLEGLSPGTSYCYEVHDGGGRVHGPALLRTAPAPGTGPVRFVAFGDSGGGGLDQEMVRRQLFQLPADLLVHTGDIAYDNGTLDDFERKFFSPYRDLLDSVPIFPTSGNHEYNSADAAPYLRAFVLPENGGDAGRERWYSFDYGHVHFVALDTERMTEAQAAWLDRDLAENRLPWTIVYGHRPPYSSGEHGSDLTFRLLFGPILEKHRVPLVLSGHDHHYERVLPQSGTLYVVTGGGGRGTRPVTPRSFTAFAEPVLHLLQVTVDGDRLSLHAVDATGRRFDSAVILRRPPDP